MTWSIGNGTKSSKQSALDFLAGCDGAHLDEEPEEKQVYLDTKAKLSDLVSTVTNDAEEGVLILVSFHAAGHGTRISSLQFATESVRV